MFWGKQEWHAKQKMNKENVDKQIYFNFMCA